jgi:hypothetical protein
LLLEFLLDGDAFGVDFDVGLVFSVRFGDRRNGGSASRGEAPGWIGWTKIAAFGRVMYSAAGMMRAKWPLTPPPRVEVIARAFAYNSWWRSWSVA